MQKKDPFSRPWTDPRAYPVPEPAKPMALTLFAAVIIASLLLLLLSACCGMPVERRDPVRSEPFSAQGYLRR